MTRRGVILGLALVGLTLNWAVVTKGADRRGPAWDKEVWQWFDGCPARQTMRLDVELGQRSLYSVVLPVCRMRSGEIADIAEQKVLVFGFQGDAALFGDELRSFGRAEIEGNVWRAGGESDSILLGVSFEVSNQILLNSIHVAAADEASSTEMADGLTVRTSRVESVEEPRFEEHDRATEQEVSPVDARKEDTK